jgi:DNA ligase (NAD+)
MYKSESSIQTVDSNAVAAADETPSSITDPSQDTANDSVADKEEREDVAAELAVITEVVSSEESVAEENTVEPVKEEPSQEKEDTEKKDETKKKKQSANSSEQHSLFG